MQEKLAKSEVSGSSQRLVVAANRIGMPAALGRGDSLPAAFGDGPDNRSGIWFGWSGEVSDRASRSVRLEADGDVDLALTDLTPREYAGYHLGYANRALWPVLHYRLDLAEFDDGAYRVFRAVNRRFARLLAPLLWPGDVVWVHGHDLLLLGRELRLNGCGWGGATGFFLHAPFPAPEMFSAVPQHMQLAHAMADFDLVGLQTPRDVDNFRRYMAQFHGAVPGAQGALEIGRRKLRVGAFPAGIHWREFERAAATPGAREAGERLRCATGDRALVLSVDPPEFSQGLPQRLRAFDRLLRDDSRLHGRVSFLQIAPPSPAAVGDPRVAREVEALSARINGEFGRLDWTPVHYLARSYPVDVHAGLLRVARVGLVTPLSDGMSLGAKEFVAAQHPADPGVLVLSGGAGAADQLEAALLVNPHDAGGVAEAIRAALEMPLDERRRRWQALAANVRREDTAWWQRTFLAALRAIRRRPIPAGSTQLAAAG